jgi:hypothetical protein
MALFYVDTRRQSAISKPINGLIFLAAEESSTILSHAHFISENNKEKKRKTDIHIMKEKMESNIRKIS